jgi:hypothetical protein
MFLGEREQCNHYQGVDCLDENPRHIGILCHPLPDEVIEDSPPGITRLKVFEPSGFIFDYVTPTSTKLRMVYTVDPWIGRVPEWLISFFLGLIAPRISGGQLYHTHRVLHDPIRKEVDLVNQ